MWLASETLHPSFHILSIPISIMKDRELQKKQLKMEWLALLLMSRNWKNSSKRHTNSHLSKTFATWVPKPRKLLWLQIQPQTLNFQRSTGNKNSLRQAWKRIWERKQTLRQLRSPTAQAKKSKQSSSYSLKLQTMWTKQTTSSISKHNLILSKPKLTNALKMITAIAQPSSNTSWAQNQTLSSRTTCLIKTLCIGILGQILTAFRLSTMTSHLSAVSISRYLWTSESTQRQKSIRQCCL